jgi:hypothetical protein
VKTSKEVVVREMRRGGLRPPSDGRLPLSYSPSRLGVSPRLGRDLHGPSRPSAHNERSLAAACAARCSSAPRGRHPTCAVAGRQADRRIPTHPKPSPYTARCRSRSGAAWEAGPLASRPIVPTDRPAQVGPPMPSTPQPSPLKRIFGAQSA